MCVQSVSSNGFPASWRISTGATVAAVAEYEFVSALVKRASVRVTEPIVHYFPGESLEDAAAYSNAYFQRLATAAATVDPAAISMAAELLERRSLDGSMIYSCGNGGSAAIANHLVCDCLKGIRTASSLRPRVHSLSATIETITAVGNDIGYEEIFAFQLESLGREGDVLIAVSSSGESPNIVNVLTKAREMKIATIAMTGFSGGKASAMADINLHVDADNYGVVEDVHQSLVHVLAQFLRHKHLEDKSMLGRLKF